MRRGVYLSCERAQCHRHPDEAGGCRIQHCRVIVAGFTCKARSALNGNAKNNRGCVQNETESTGESFKAVRLAIEKHMPDVETTKKKKIPLSW